MIKQAVHQNNSDTCTTRSLAIFLVFMKHNLKHFIICLLHALAG